MPPLLFVYAVKPGDVPSLVGINGPPPPAHEQLGAWYGDGTYQGIILSFFKSTSDARASLKTLASLYGGEVIGNVVATWDQKAAPAPNVRKVILGCLRAEGSGSRPASNPPPPATLATFAGSWGGHTRGLSITATGSGREFADSGCCVRGYQMTFQILAVGGNVTHADATYRVTSFASYLNGVDSFHVGDLGKLLLSDGIVTNALTRDDFCSDPAWGATGACGA